MSHDPSVFARSTLLPGLIREINAAAIQRDIATYWGFRSTVPGPGLQAAGEFLARRQRENGIRVEIHSYAADDETEHLDGHKHPLAWFPRSARLEIAAPSEHAGLICDFAQEPLCLISNSVGKFPAGITSDVVVIANATHAGAYNGLDVRGKIVFTDVWPLLADEQARQHGALGIITDSVTPPWLHNHPPVRQAADVSDLTMWGILNGHRKEHPLWAFSLTPRQGAHLRQIIRDASEPVRLHVRMDAELAPGTSELITALLPGGDLAGEEIWILSHSSEPGAIDDASGCCASLEIARILKLLIQSGALPPLRRSIRFLSAVETEGYLPYLGELLDKNKSSKLAEGAPADPLPSGSIQVRPGQSLDFVIAALAFDGVGADFRKTGGSCCLIRSPDYNPSFADDLLEAIIAAVAAEQNLQFTPDNYDIFPWRVEPCFPGNDNMLADGFFDVPTPMLICWPDKFYHSNLDTPDKISQGSLARSAVIGAAYLYLLATAGPDEARWMAGLTLRGWKHRILNGAPVLQGVDALTSILRLEPTLENVIAAMTHDLLAFAQHQAHSARRFEPGSAVQPGAETAPTAELPADFQNIMFRPRCWKPPTPGQLSPEGQSGVSPLYHQYPEMENVWWLINGRRTARELCARTNLPAEGVVAYLMLLRQDGWIS